MEFGRAFFLVFLAGILGIFIQGTVLRTVMPETMIVPNLAVTIVAFLAFYEVSIFGACLAFLLGLVFDLASGTLLGPWAGAYVVVYGLLCTISQRVFVESAVTAFIAVLAGAIGAQVVYLMILGQFRSSEILASTLTFRVVLEALLSAFFAPLVFGALRRLRLVRSGYSR